MKESELRLKRRQAYGAMRDAVQAHERNPSDLSVRAVESACARMRQIGEEETWARRSLHHEERYRAAPRKARSFERA
jgi:Flp pilus assembly protein TadD